MVVALDSLSTLSAQELHTVVSELVHTISARDQQLVFKQTVIDKLTHENAILKRLKFAAQSERFSAERARWVALEQWHPGQKSHFEKDGRYVLQLPYSDDRELVMDILRHVPEVQVIGPAGLREAVAEKLRMGLERVMP